MEVSETAGPGALRPNVRRVYKDLGEGDNRHKVLICREIDTNLDGIKDVVRTFNARGEALKENADTNYDGKLDVWTTFVNGRMSEEDVDTNFDGAPDVWKIYVDGKLSRIKRDRNFDGKPDVWEIYSNGHLERMGLDDTYDGHVDRWDRDQSVHAQEDQATAAAAGGSSVAAPTSIPGPGRRGPTPRSEVLSAVFDGEDRGCRWAGEARRRLCAEHRERPDAATLEASEDRAKPWWSLRVRKRPRGGRRRRDPASRPR